MPTTKAVDGRDLANLFFECWIRYKNFTLNIVKDRGQVFHSLFWQHMMRKMRVNITIITAWHPERDGQTVRINSMLNMYMSSFSDGDQLQ